MSGHTTLQRLAIRALKAMTIEHIVPNLARLKKITIDITQGSLLSGDRTAFYVILDGDCHVQARVSVHGKQNGRRLVTVYFLAYQLPGSTSLLSPLTSHEVTL